MARRILSTIARYWHLHALAFILAVASAGVALALGAAERLLAFLDEPEDPALSAGGLQPAGIRGEVAFEDVSFSYDGSRPVLEGVTCRLAAGTTTALVGPSGAGKSTLMQLIPRFYDPDRGRVLLDGVDLKEYDVRWLRSQIGIVSQEVFIFTGTRWENIAIGKEEATEEEVRRAAEAALVDEFARELPLGYDTVLGDRGANLSGGQRQRVAIARALLRNPRILLLDEATSALDPVAESRVQEAVERLREGRTTLVIAHRMSTARRADRILFLQRGRIVEETHAELMALNGGYARFCALQFSGEASAEGAAS